MLIKVDESGQGKRLDTFLQLALKDSFNVPISRSVGSRVAQIAVVNGEGVKRSYRLKQGDEVGIDEKAVKSLLKTLDKQRNSVSKVEPQEGELRIIDENDDWLVLYKPKGLVVHPGVGNYSDTLANYVAGYLRTKGEYGENIKRGGVVHRLDKGVSGLIVFAKNLQAQDFLSAQFQKRLVKKVYIAQVVKLKDSTVVIPKDSRPVRLQIEELLEEGVDEGWLKVEGMISRDSVNRKRMRFNPLSKSGKRALSYVKDIGGGRFMISIHTGRMHQIRATLRYLGFSIQNDLLYGYKGEVVGEGIGLESVVLQFKDLSGGIHTYTL